jgi:hypothetical protein
LALANIGDHRLVSAFALTGFVGLLLGTLIRAAGPVMALPPYRGNMPIPELGFWLSVINYTATAVTIIAMVFLMAAIFTDRERPELRKRREP